MDGISSFKCFTCDEYEDTTLFYCCGTYFCTSCAEKDTSDEDGCLNCYGKVVKDYQDIYKRTQDTIHKLKTVLNILEIQKEITKTSLEQAKIDLYTCSYCNDRVETKVCSQCLKVRYCDRECQIDDWCNHKISCQKLINH